MFGMTNDRFRHTETPNKSEKALIILGRSQGTIKCRK